MKLFKNKFAAIFTSVLVLCALVSCGNYYPYGYGNYCPYCGNAYNSGHNCSTASSTATPTSTPAATPTATPAAPQVPTTNEIINKLNAKRTEVGNSNTLVENPGISQRAKGVLDAYIDCGCADTAKFKKKRDYIIGGTFIIGNQTFARNDVVNIEYSDDFTDIFSDDFIIAGSSKYVGCAAKAHGDKVYCTIIVASIPSSKDNLPKVSNTNTPTPAQTNVQSQTATGTLSATSTQKPINTPTVEATQNNGKVQSNEPAQTQPNTSAETSAPMQTATPVSGNSAQLDMDDFDS